MNNKIRGQCSALLKIGCLSADWMPRALQILLLLYAIDSGLLCEMWGVYWWRSFNVMDAIVESVHVNLDRTQTAQFLHEITSI